MTRRQIFRHLLKASRKGKDLLSNPYYWGFFVVKKLIWFAVAYFIMANPANAALNYEDYPVVKLRSLDKITARTMTFEAKVGATVRFGEIFIKVQSCRKPPPVEKSESAAFLQIWQTNDEKNTSKWIFSGWMFASSPALSSMEHPVYDVWVLDCLGRDPEPVPVEDDAKGVQAPVTDGEAPDAVPPTIEPDKQAPVKPTDENGVTADEDPGAFEDEQPTVPQTQLPQDPQEQETVPATNIPADAQVAPSYMPDHSQEDYQDETPADDSSPVDDTMSGAPAEPTKVIAPPSQAAPETLEPQPQPEEKPAGQDFNGIY